MRVGDSVRVALRDYTVGDLEPAMLHACNAVDGTAAKRWPIAGSAARFTDLIRASHSIVGPMGAPGINLDTTRFPVAVKKARAPDGRPDLADVLYGVHRCSHGHGDELPAGFALIPAPVDGITEIRIEQGRVALSARMVPALLAVAVLASENASEKAPDDCWLSLGGVRLPVNDWWGRHADFDRLAAQQPAMPLVTLDFGDWMTGL
jgi:hypothetical protein